MLPEADDPFQAFADEMARAANVEAEAGLPLLNQSSGSNASPDLSSVNSLEEVAEIFLRAEAQRKSAAIQKKAASAYLTALSANKGVDHFDTKSFTIHVDREEVEAFDADVLQAELALRGEEPPDFVNVKPSLTPGEIKALDAAQRAKLGNALSAKPDKITITIERK